ncbi:hypothetical protein AN958_12641 [Leucoagaricus sp. SymC.cos]|nr:hypothetical protein AN958_12641 [Leucoagaricus sp. SymC.cos]
MEAQDTTFSRPRTPESSLSSLCHATNTIDDLTLALSSFSRGTSPEPQINLICCCGREHCENLHAWHECKARLETRLTLSAEVGQALLRRHEAYVGRHEVQCRIKQTTDLRQQNVLSDDEEDDDNTKVFRQEQFDVQYAELLKEKQALEKSSCIDYVLIDRPVNNEVTEVSNKTLLQELHESRTTISRLTAHHARSIGWDTRLTAALKERDDMQQERDSESHRARLAESRFAALKDKTIKLQTEVRRLQEALEEKRSHRLESSGTLLQDARSRIESLRETSTFDTMDGYEEVTRMLESLVQDNETLKHDNAELQQLLTDTREDFAALQEEYEEYKANPPISLSGTNTPNSRHSHRPSIASLTSKDYPVFTNTFNERKPRRNLELLTLDPNRPLSPTDALSPATLYSKTLPRYSPSRYSFELETPNDDPEIDSSMEKRRSHKPLLLLSRSRGVQTEPSDVHPSSFLSPSPMSSLLPSLSPHDRSEASSFSESSSMQMASLVDRITSLLMRMTQTDPLTLTNRLKRQHLKGADVGHLSKTTISNILSEVNALRQQYRSLLEEDKAALPVTRKDLRGLFKFLRDVFIELGQIRTTLNEVILDPTLAPKISDRALHPEREKEVDKDAPANSSAQSWIAPISRLFSPTRDDLPPSITRSDGTRHRNTRFVPKSGPALAASAMTVNVEFSGIGGRSTTNARTTSPVRQSPPTEGTTALLDIFAGAPQLSTSTDTWVVVPPPTQARRMASMVQLGSGAVLEYPSNGPIPEATRTIGRNTVLPIPKEEIIPRAVDAVIDESQGQVAPLLQRTLRRRGLSDSSIHSTFVAQVQQQEAPIMNASGSQGINPLSGAFKTAWSDGSSVFQALSRTVQNLKLGGSGGPGSEPNLAGAVAPSSTSTKTVTSTAAAPSEQSVTEPPARTQTPRPSAQSIHTSSCTSTTKAHITSSPSEAQPTFPATSPKSPNASKAVTMSPRKSRIPDFTSWTAASFMLDPANGVSDPFIARNVVGSFREESFFQRTQRFGDDI